MTIRNVIFDMAGVLIESSFESACRLHVQDEADRALVRRELFSSVEWIQMDRGLLGHDEVAEAACARLPERLHASVRAIMAGWHKKAVWMPGMDPLVRRVKTAGYGVYLLSNTAKSFHGFDAQMPAYACFDGMFISADCQLLKPDPAIFHAFCTQFARAPGECVFIDDSNANVEAAIYVGMRGIVFRGDADRLAGELQGLGVRLAD